MAVKFSQKSPSAGSALVLSQNGSTPDQDLTHVLNDDDDDDDDDDDLPLLKGVPPIPQVKHRGPSREAPGCCHTSSPQSRWAARRPTGDRLDRAAFAVAEVGESKIAAALVAAGCLEHAVDSGLASSDKRALPRQQFSQRPQLSVTSFPSVFN